MSSRLDAVPADGAATGFRALRFTGAFAGVFGREATAGAATALAFGSGFAALLEAGFSAGVFFSDAATASRGADGESGAGFDLKVFRAAGLAACAGVFRSASGAGAGCFAVDSEGGVEELWGAERFFTIYSVRIPVSQNRDFIT
jgi:hypothetical protein